MISRYKVACQRMCRLVLCHAQGSQLDHGVMRGSNVVVTLNQFCIWQHSKNGVRLAGEVKAQPHDVAILLTGWEKGKSGFLDKYVQSSLDAPFNLDLSLKNVEYYYARSRLLTTCQMFTWNHHYLDSESEFFLKQSWLRRRWKACCQEGRCWRIGWSLYELSGTRTKN